MRARKSALSSQSGNLLFMFAMGFNLLWSCWGFVVMVSNRESDRKGKRMTEKQRIEKNCWRKSTHVCYLRVLWRCLLLPGNETDVWSLSLHVVDIFSMMCFFTFWQKPSLFSVLSFVYVEFYISSWKIWHTRLPQIKIRHLRYRPSWIGSVSFALFGA